MIVPDLDVDDELLDAMAAFDLVQGELLRDEVCVLQYWIYADFEEL